MRVFKAIDDPTAFLRCHHADTDDEHDKHDEPDEHDEPEYEVSFEKPSEDPDVPEYEVSFDEPSDEVSFEEPFQFLDEDENGLQLVEYVPTDEDEEADEEDGEENATAASTASRTIIPSKYAENMSKYATWFHDHATKKHVLRWGGSKWTRFEDMVSRRPPQYWGIGADTMMRALKGQGPRWEFWHNEHGPWVTRRRRKDGTWQRSVSKGSKFMKR